MKSSSWTTVLPLFGEDAPFVKYLFHVMNIHFVEASALLDENAALKAELGKIKGALPVAEKSIVDIE